MTRIQKERLDDPAEYERVKGSYVLTRDLVERTDPDLTIIHPRRGSIRSPRTSTIYRTRPTPARRATACLCAYLSWRWSWGGCSRRHCGSREMRTGRGVLQSGSVGVKSGSPFPKLSQTGGSFPKKHLSIALLTTLLVCGIMFLIVDQRDCSLTTP